MITDTKDYVNWFRHSSPYINAHRGKTFVLMISGDAIEDPNFGNIIHDIALFNSLGVRLVIAFGARPQIESRFQQQNKTCKFHLDVRITDAAALQIVKEAVGTCLSLGVTVEGKNAKEFTADINAGTYDSQLKGD